MESKAYFEAIAQDWDAMRNNFTSDNEIKKNQLNEA